MSRPFLLLQLSDLHVGWDAADPLGGLVAVLEAIRALPDRPDALVVTGDLADGGAPEEYAAARAALARLGLPVHVLAGNHDDRAALRAEFGVEGAAGEPVQYAADLGPLRLVALDTVLPGEGRGELDRERLDWLETTLAAEPARSTVLALHHPPLATGMAVWDDIGLRAADRVALGEVLARHRQVLAVIGGHTHRTMVGELAGRPVVAVPSTSIQTRLDFSTPDVLVDAGGIGFAVHALVRGGLATHVQPVA